MSYQTGTATDFSDLMAKIETFLGINGWTKTGEVLHKGNVFVKLASGTTLTCYGGTGESGGILTGDAPDLVRMRENYWVSDTITWPVVYRLFTLDSPTFFLVNIQYNTDYLQWLTFGELVKFGTWGGGQYIGASFPEAHSTSSVYQTRFYNYNCLRYNTNNATSLPGGLGLWWAANGSFTNEGHMLLASDIDGGSWIDSNENSPTGGLSGVVLARELAPNSPNSWNEQAILAPVIVAQERPDNFRSILGTPEHVRFVNMLNYKPGDIITLGPDKWMVFPHFRYSTATLTGHTSNAANSGRLGYAVKYDGP